MTPKRLAYVAFQPFVLSMFLVLANFGLGVWDPNFTNAGFSVVLWSFLPMCFFYAGMFMADNRRVAQHLQQRIEALEGANEQEGART